MVEGARLESVYRGFESLSLRHTFFRRISKLQTLSFPRTIGVRRHLTTGFGESKNEPCPSYADRYYKR